jgi:hypothetical protein
MYCSSCGVALTTGLSFCNYCGEKLAGAKSGAGKTPEVRPETLIAAMVFTFVLGLGAITMLMGVMKAILHMEAGEILPLALPSFFLLVILEGVFIRLLLRRRQGNEAAGDSVRLKGQATRELEATPPRVLPEAMPSVTEHTTRTFDPVYSERTEPKNESGR